MKEKLKTYSGWPSQVRELALAFWEHPTAQITLQALVRFSLCTLLSIVSVGGQPMPFALALLALSGHGVLGLGALLGCTAGYIGQFSLLGSLEPLATAILICAANLTLRDFACRNRPWLLPAVYLVLSSLVSLLYLLEAGFRPAAICLFLTRLGLLAVSLVCFDKALAGHFPSRLFLGGCLIGGLASWQVFTVPLGAVAAVATAIAGLSSTYALPIAAVCGLALDFTLQPALPLTAVFCLANLLCQAMILTSRPFQALVHAACTTASVLYFQGANPELVVAGIFGSLLSLAVPARIFPLEQARPAGAAQIVSRQLHQAADVLEDIHDTLTRQRRTPTEPEAALVFDRAADKVCKCCVLYNTCWEEESSQTYRCLCAAVRPMLTQGQVTRQNFPEAFTSRCRHLEGFLTAVNQELDNLLYRRQFRNRIQESRQIVSEQYGFWSDYLRLTARNLTVEQPVVLHYLPQLGVCAAGKGGSRLSGDRGASFRTQDGRYYIVLCDGMGTGPEAAGESTSAVSTLSSLLLAGMRAEQALETLNGIYILRGDGAFSTIDLLEVDLCTGLAQLYKWGAAPSYLKLGKTVKKIGTASPPPGFGVGTTYKAQRIGLSLEKGEMLVLLSDGAGGEETERQLGSWEEMTPRELAESIIAGAQTQGEDDMTAAVLSLHPCPAP